MLHARLAVEKKTDFTKTYKSAKRFSLVKTDSKDLYMPTTCFAVLKMVPPNVYKPPNKLCGSQNGL